MRKHLTFSRRAALLSLLAIAGCDQIDPMTRPYVWHPTDVNRHNIAAMADNPNDLLEGRESPGRRAVLETDAIDRLWTARPLPLLSISGGGGGAGGGGSTGGSAPPSGGGT